MFRIAIAAAVICLSGCRYDCGPRAPAAPAPGQERAWSRSFSDEQYIWQDWLYGTNKSDKAWR